MTSVELVAHPDTPCPAVTTLHVVARRSPDGDLRLEYVLDGDLGGLRLPPPALARAADGLWRHTCFEAFVGIDGKPGYLEFNFSPSGCWAAYAFAGYRGPSMPHVCPNPRIATQLDGQRLILHAGPIRLPAAVPWRLAPAAVVEPASGTPSYWALAHPPGKPDFHRMTAWVTLGDNAIRP